jgi:RNA polymerase sigma factor (sigma-70 family)
MMNPPLQALVQFLRKVSDGHAAADLTDGQLLARFRDRRDEAAFVELLQRHGPLVLGVCQRLLHDPHDTEDAFQATFLLLLRKAHAIVKQGSVASWLHGVAHRVAVRLKGENARRRQRERQAYRPPAPDLLQEIVFCDLRAMLDEEVLRLPARCREPFVLCYLEGKTNEEAARLLGCPRGTVQSRLLHARELLRARLARRGLTLSGGLLAALLPQPTATAVPTALIDATARMAQATLAPGAAVAAAVSSRVWTLAEGGLTTMGLGKIKAVVAACLLAGVVLAGAGAPGGNEPTEAGVPTPAATAPLPQPGKVSPDVRKLLKSPDPQVRLKTALPLAEQLDEEAITTLIDLLAVLPPAQRRLAEQTLQGIAEEWSPTPALAGDDEISRRILRDAWAGWWRNADGEGLLAAFRKRTLSPEQTAKAKARIADLGDKVFATRQRATADLVALGPPVVPLLRQALRGADLEQGRRLGHCLEQIARDHERDTLPVVAARLLALRKPAGATATLLAYVAFTEDEVMKGEVAKALQRLAGSSADAGPVLVKALQDAAPVRRAVAGEALAGVADAEVRAAVRKLLADPDAEVRLRVAVALACAADRQAVPVLIDLLADLPADQWWRAEEILSPLAGAKAPPPVAGDDAPSRQKHREAWRAWYAAHGANAKLTPRPVPPPLLGFTTIALLAPPPDRTKSRVMEVDRHGKERWGFTCHYPVDVRVLPGNRVLVSEFEAMRVTERDLKGNILWQVKDLQSAPYNVQRLANGNTFVAAGRHLLEFDAAGKTVFAKDVEEAAAGYKLPDGQMVYLTAAKGMCVWLDAAGREVKRFHSAHYGESGCVLDLTPRGSLLVTQGFKNAAVEFDLEGNPLWQVQGNNLTGIATEARNGHLTVANLYQSRVVRVDRSGRVVWQCQTPGFNPFLARQR